MWQHNTQRKSSISSFITNTSHFTFGQKN